MVVDEAHFIKNKQSQRSQNVLHLSEQIRARTARPLLLALTGTPLINDIEDFHAIWEYLGWIDDKKPLAKLMDKLEETGLTPADPGFYPAARNSVVEMGIVRRRKVDVAADIPARRIADLPGRARRRDRPLDPRGRARARPAAARALRHGARHAPYRLGHRGHRPRAGPPGRDLGARGHHDHHQGRRQRLHDAAPDRPGQGRSRRRLRRPAGAQRRQGRLLRQARRRHGPRRRHLRASAGSATPRSAATRRPRPARRRSRPSRRTPRSRSSSAR